MKLKQKFLRRALAVISGGLMVAIAFVVLLSQQGSKDLANEFGTAQFIPGPAPSVTSLFSNDPFNSTVEVGRSVNITVRPSPEAVSKNLLIDSYVHLYPSSSNVTVNSPKIFSNTNYYTQVALSLITASSGNHQVTFTATCKAIGTTNLSMYGFYADKFNASGPSSVYGGNSTFTSTPINCVAPGSTSISTTAPGLIAVPPGGSLRFITPTLTTGTGQTSTASGSFTPVGTTGTSIFACSSSPGVMTINVRAANPRTVLAKLLIGYKTSGTSGTIYRPDVSNGTVQIKGQTGGLAPEWAYAEIPVGATNYAYSYDWNFSSQDRRTASLSTSGRGMGLPVQKLYIILAAANSANNGVFGGAMNGEIAVDSSNLPSCAGTTTNPTPAPGPIKQPQPFQFQGKTVYTVNFENGETLESVCNADNKVADKWYDDINIAHFATGNSLAVQTSSSGDGNISICGTQQSGICLNQSFHNTILNCPACTAGVGLNEKTSLYKYMFGACKGVPAAPPTPISTVIATNQTGGPQQTVNGSCRAGYTADLSHLGLLDSEVGFAISLNNGLSFQAVPVTAASSSVSGSLVIDNTRLPYQIALVKTSSATSVKVDYEFDMSSLLLGVVSSQLKLKILTKDTSGNTSESTTNSFTMDCKNPSAFGPVVVSNVGTSTSTVSWTNTSTDANFATYQISVGTNRADVLSFSGTATVRSLSTQSAVNIGLIGMTPGTAYFVSVRAVDDFGNTTVAGIQSFSTTTAAGPGGAGGTGTGTGGTGTGGTGTGGTGTGGTGTAGTGTGGTGTGGTGTAGTGTGGTGTGGTGTGGTGTGGTGTGGTGTGGTGTGGGITGTGTGTTPVGAGTGPITVTGSNYAGTWTNVTGGFGSGGTANAVLGQTATTFGLQFSSNGAVNIPPTGTVNITVVGTIANGVLTVTNSNLPAGTVITGTVAANGTSFSIFIQNNPSWIFDATILATLTNNGQVLSGSALTYPQGSNSVQSIGQCTVNNTTGGICHQNNFELLLAGTGGTGTGTGGTGTGTGGTGTGTGGTGTGTGTGGTGAGGTGTGTGTGTVTGTGTGTGIGGTGGTGTGGTGTGTGGTGTGGTSGTGTGGTGTGTGGTGTGGTGTGTGGTGTGTGGTGGTGTGGTGTGTGGTGTGTGGTGTGTGGTGTGTGGTGTGTGGTGTGTGGTGGTGTGGTGTGGGITGTGTGTSPVGAGTGGTGTGGTGGTGTGGTGTGTGGTGTGTGGTGTGTGGTGTGTGVTGIGTGGTGTGTGTSGTGTTSTGGGGSTSGSGSGDSRVRSLLTNGEVNCFEHACSTQEQKAFVETAGIVGNAFSTRQQQVVEFIDVLSNEGITAEELSINFTRSIAVKVAVQILIENGKANSADIESVLTTGFPDVSMKDKYGLEIGYAKKIGLIKGKPNGTFGPDEPLTLAAAYKILSELMARLDEGVSTRLGLAAMNVSVDWFHKYVIALSVYIPVFDQYSQLGQSIGGVFYMTLLNEVMSAVGIYNPLNGLESTIQLQ